MRVKWSVSLGQTILVVRRKASPGSFGISAARGMMSIGAALADFDVAVPVFVRAESGHVIGFAAPGVNGSVSVQYEMHSQLRGPSISTQS